MSAAVLLLTGATGLVGGELLHTCLTRQPDRRVILLVRNREKIPRSGNSEQITVIESDLTRPGLGLDSATLCEIQREATEIIHCAADTRFGLPIEQARATNTRGTSGILKIAQGCKHLKKLAYLSTAYVAGRTTGHIPEGALRNHTGFINTYQQSKYEAEQLVLEAMSEIPAVIYRLSTIIGDSRTGRVKQFNYFHKILRLLAKNVLPVVPGHPSWRIDLIPTDWASSALAFLFESSFVPGQIIHICAGAGGSPTIAEARDIALDLFEEHPLIKKWLPLRVPELVSLPAYEEYVRKSLQSGDNILIELLKVLDTFLPQMGIEQCFDIQRLLQKLDGSAIRLCSFRDYYGKVVTHCLETDWGRKQVIDQ
jgi:nucleoside-diphosphate-sugar epimerase